MTITTKLLEARATTTAVLTSPLFMIAAALLLLNDFWWKYAYPGWITGKLSDFAGLFVMACLLQCVFWSRRYIALVLIAVAFTWWKSALSQPLIDGFNALGIFTIGRTPDWSDLMALVSLPIATAWVARRRLANTRTYPGRRLLTVIAAMTTVLAVSATSYIHAIRDIEVTTAIAGGQIDADAINQVIAEIAERHSMRVCPEVFWARLPDVEEHGLYSVNEYCARGVSLHAVIPKDLGNVGIRVIGTKSEKVEQVSSDLQLEIETTFRNVAISVSEPGIQN